MVLNDASKSSRNCFEVRLLHAFVVQRKEQGVHDRRKELTGELESLNAQEQAADAFRSKEARYVSRLKGLEEQQQHWCVPTSTHLRSDTRVACTRILMSVPGSRACQRCGRR